MADIEVSAAALTQHASEIDTYMTALREAAAAGDQSFDLRAFGLIGSTWSSVLQLWCSDAKNLVDTSADSGQQIASAMREMAESYAAQDSSSAQTFSQLHSQLGAQ
jgi:hypothetical protein